MNRMSKTEIPAASGTNITSNASAISTAASSSTAQRTFLSKYRLHKKFVAAAGFSFWLSSCLSGN